MRGDVTRPTPLYPTEYLVLYVIVHTFFMGLIIIIELVKYFQNKKFGPKLVLEYFFNLSIVTSKTIKKNQHCLFRFLLASRRRGAFYNSPSKKKKKVKK